MRLPRVRFIVWYGFLVLLLAAVGSGGWLLHLGISTSIEAENNLHFSLFALRLVERFISENGRWPRSWRELEDVPMGEGPFGREWPAASPELRRRISIDFGADPHAVARQDAMSFTAIQPIGPYYEYRQYGGVQSLQQAIRKSLRGGNDEASKAPVDVSSEP